MFVDLGVNDPTLLWVLVQDNTAPQDWSAARNIAQTVQGGVAAAAAIAAVVWGLYVFRVGRHSAGHVHIQIDLTKVINTSKGKVAVLSIKLKNTGRTRVERDKDKQKCCLSITPIRRDPAARYPDAQIVVSTDRHDKGFKAHSDCGKRKGWVIFKNLTALEPDEETAEDALLRWNTFDDFLGTTPMFRVGVTFRGGSLRLWGPKTKTWGSRRVVIIDNDAVTASEHAQGAEENQANVLNKQIPSGEEIEDKPSGRFIENIDDLREKNLPGKDLRNADLRNADLTEANLRGANLSRANLSNANLSKANLRGATMVRATMTGATMPDGSKHD